VVAKHQEAALRCRRSGEFDRTDHRGGGETSQQAVDRYGGASALVPLPPDLTYLQRVDAEGIALLNALADAGAQLRHVSPYIALRLRHSRR
jgi:hypothetical protein